jgi:hypothetical protein
MHCFLPVIINFGRAADQTLYLPLGTIRQSRIVHEARVAVK